MKTSANERKITETFPKDVIMFTIC